MKNSPSFQPAPVAFALGSSSIAPSRPLGAAKVLIRLCLFAFATVLAALAGDANDAVRETFGPRFNSVPYVRPEPRHGHGRDIDAIRRWNEIAINASGFDHANAKEQLGPCRSSRALAIVQIAVFDALNSVVGGYESYTGLQAPRGPVSLQAAVSQAAHDTLVALFPSQTLRFDTSLALDLGEVKDKKGKANGIDLGKRAAAAILLLRSNDGAENPEIRVGTNNGDYISSNLPGHWRQDPISLIPLALGARWSNCAPFVLQRADQFRVPPFPSMASPEYAAAFNEAKRLGGDGINTPTQRTAEQTHIGIFWAYDGTPSLCAPPRLYNQIALQIADQMGTDGIELARLLALANVAMAEAGLAAWDSKYYYDIWRPITGIRESDPGTGPTGLGDGNAATVGDPGFMPLGAPASNLQGPNFTPPFPAYPSGHATFGGALFQTLRRFYRTDNIRFTFVSDEFNGITRANDGTVRPYMPRTFRSLSQAEEENGQSRIYLGIHWSFDKVEGIAQGRKVGNYVFDHTFRPLRRDRDRDHDRD